MISASLLNARLKLVGGVAAATLLAPPPATLPGGLATMAASIRPHRVTLIALRRAVT